MKTWIRMATLVMFTAAGTLNVSAQASMATPKQTPTTVSAPADDNMTPYRKMATDALTAFKAHDAATAKKKASELEKAWDNEQKALEKQNPSVWKQIDDAMDLLVKPLQSRNPDAAKVQVGYDTFIAKLQLAVKK